MTQQEADAMNLEMLLKAVPADRPEMVEYIQKMNKAFEKYKTLSRLVSEMTFEKSVDFFAKIFQQEKNNQHFYWKYVEKGDSFMLFIQSLDYKNQFLFLDFLFEI